MSSDSNPRSVRADTLRYILDRSPDYLKISIRASLLSAVLGGFGSAITGLWGNAAGRPSYFLLVWALLGGVGAFVVLYLLASAATERNDPFISRGFKLATACLMPPVLTSLAVLLLLSRTGMSPSLLAPTVAALYGLCILSTAAFAPRAIRRLGWAFLITGAAILFVLIAGYTLQAEAIIKFPAWIATAATFFLLHALYPVRAAFAKAD